MNKRNETPTLDKTGKPAPSTATPKPVTPALDFLAEVASMRIVQVVDKKRMGISVVNRWSPFAQAMTITGQAQISAEAIGNPIRLKVDENGTPQFNARGLPKAEVHPEIKGVADSLQKGIDAYILQATNEARFANVEAWGKVSEQARSAGINARKAEVKTLTDYKAKMDPKS